jgi:hypothetical protein
MNNSFIKIEIIDSKPVVSFEYSSIEDFKDLMFFIMSESGLNLLYNSIEQNLISNDKNEEIDMLNMIISVLNSSIDLNSTDDDFIDPCSFA